MSNCGCHHRSSIDFGIWESWHLGRRLMSSTVVFNMFLGDIKSLFFLIIWWYNTGIDSFEIEHMRVDCLFRTNESSLHKTNVQSAR